MPKLYVFAILLSAMASQVGAQARLQIFPNADADWPMYAHDYMSTRYSPHTEITPSNVANLKQICSYTLPEASTFESSLVEFSGTLYFTTGETTYAIDAANCRLKWSEKHALPAPEPDRTVRGVAVDGKRLFRGFRDGVVIAYQISNGEQLWSTRLAAPDGRTANIAAAPLAWNGMVFIGTSGAEQNCACFVAGIDAATGRVVWKFNTTPSSGQSGADSWPQGITPGGGSTWTSFTIDPETSSLYFSTGNPGYDFAADYRTGANLYTNSVVVLDAKTGRLRDYYQIVPHDYHDWDLTASPVLLTTKSGQRRVMAAGKDGFLTAIDPNAQKVLWKAPVTTIENIEAPLTPQGTHVCPGATGGVQWNGPAFSPATNLVYVNAIDWCSTIKSDPDFDLRKNFLGSANAFGDHDPEKTGWVTAVDADSGAVRWKFKANTPMVAGIAVTAGRLVLTADLDSDLLAFDAQSGRLVHRFKLGQPTGGGVITYVSGGKQRIAIATGLEDRILQVHGRPAVMVLGL